MKLVTFVFCVVLALVLAAPWLSAQPHKQGNPKITVDVPFDFMVGQVMFPAGNYRLRPLKNRTLYLQATQGRESLAIATTTIRRAWNPGTAHLMFAKENGHYQLRELWMNSAIGVEVPNRGVEQLHPVRESGVEVPVTCTGCD